MKLLVAALCLTILISSVVATHAQGQQNVRRRMVSQARRQNPKTTGHITEPFDSSVVKLPTGFRGHNAVSLYKHLIHLQASYVKGEFETTDAYQQRLNKEISKPLLGTLTLDSLFAFVISDLDSTYNADRQVLHTRAPLGIVIERARTARNVRSEKSLRWGAVYHGKDYYTGSNVFGKQVVVESSLSDVFEIAFGNYEQFPTEKYFSKLTQELIDDDKKFSERVGVPPNRWDYDTQGETAFVADLKIEPRSAIKAKKNLRLLLLCRVVSPYVIEGLSGRTATVSEPTEFFAELHSIMTELREIWFFDVLSGTIYAKQKVLVQ